MVQELQERLAPKCVVLDSKNVMDIVICPGASSSARVLFLEVKYLKDSSGRIGIGDWEGKGFQPEILRKRPTYFEAYMRWLIAAEDGWAVFVDNELIRKHASGGSFVPGKQNNIRESIFTEDAACVRTEDSLSRVVQWIEESV